MAARTGDWPGRPRPAVQAQCWGLWGAWHGSDVHSQPDSQEETSRDLTELARALWGGRRWTLLRPSPSPQRISPSPLLCPSPWCLFSICKAGSCSQKRLREAGEPSHAVCVWRPACSVGDSPSWAEQSRVSPAEEAPLSMSGLVWVKEQPPCLPQALFFPFQVVWISWSSVWFGLHSCPAGAG